MLQLEAYYGIKTGLKLEKLVGLCRVVEEVTGIKAHSFKPIAGGNVFTHESEAHAGFILQEGGGEVYFHKNALHGLNFEDLEDGTEVAFNVEEGEKGPQATTVNPVPIVS